MASRRNRQLSMIFWKIYSSKCKHLITRSIVERKSDRPTDRPWFNENLYNTHTYIKPFEYQLDCCDETRKIVILSQYVMFSVLVIRLRDFVNSSSSKVPKNHAWTACIHTSIRRTCYYSLRIKDNITLKHV